MIDQIIAAGNPVSQASTQWLREKMRSVSRYKNLEPKITHFTIGRYGRYPMVFAWKDDGRQIPLPKNELRNTKSKKTRVLGNLRKVVDYQVLPHRRRGFHVDHVYPFERIVTDWLALTGLTWETVTARHYPSFDAYHLKVAKYQLLTPAENIKKSNTYASD